MKAVRRYLSALTTLLAWFGLPVPVVEFDESTPDGRPRRKTNE